MKQQCCPTCSRPVPLPTDNYCEQCGTKLAALSPTKVNDILRSAHLSVSGLEESIKRGEVDSEWMTILDDMCRLVSDSVNRVRRAILDTDEEIDSHMELLSRHNKRHRERIAQLEAALQTIKTYNYSGGECSEIAKAALQDPAICPVCSMHRGNPTCKECCDE